ncbi:citrate transporter [Thiocapsa imhoffii]|uniref:Citrate transporter n=1 Tax=Thiocapsa imhoffii TaxID=382777 RepID=A0A9X0WFX2_9GAMM|nr:citrate transporter [Thiocapsa imhoffii]
MSITLIVFLVVYLGMILGGLPGLKMDRASVALGGAVALLAFGALDGAAAIATIDFGTLGMLFGLMLVSVQLQTAGFYAALSGMVARIQATQVMLLGLLIALVGVLSAFLTNDVVAVAMTPVVLAIALRRGMNPLPFLLAIALAANAGSVATIIGSPQNMLIAQRLELGFGGYLVYALVPALLALLVVWAVLAFAYRGRWTLEGSEAPRPDALPDPSFDRWETIKGLLVLFFLLYAFVFTEWDRGMVATVGGVLMLFNARFMARPMLEKVDWDLLILFVGLFIVNGAFANAGFSTELVTWLRTMGVDLHNSSVLFAATAVLSDITSNVPTVMLLLPFAGEDPLAGPLMALASGLSSNLIIIGSLANIIVVDAAAAKGLKISFWNFAKIGLPVSVVTLSIAYLWVRLVVAH